jgi:hypothetical protein
MTGTDLCVNKSQFVPVIFEPPCTRWFKYDRDDLCVNKSQFVPVIFEPPCIYIAFVPLY